LTFYYNNSIIAAVMSAYAMVHSEFKLISILFYCMVNATTAVNKCGFNDAELPNKVLNNKYKLITYILLSIRVVPIII